MIHIDVMCFEEGFSMLDSQRKIVFELVGLFVIKKRLPLTLQNADFRLSSNATAAVPVSKTWGVGFEKKR